MAVHIGFSDLQREVNQVLDRLNLPYICEKPVLPDGNCFFNSVAQLMDPIRSTLSARSKRIFGPTQLRKAVVRFMEWDERIHCIEQFKVWKASIEYKEGWLPYLKRMKNDGEYAEDLVIWATALFIGKDILQAGDINDDKAPWTPVYGSIVDTPFKATLPPLTVAYLSQRHYEPIQVQNAETKCLGCRWNGQSSLLTHLTRRQSRLCCKIFYDIPLMRSDSKKKSREKYKRNNPEQVQASHKKYRKNNPEKVQESLKKCKEVNPEKVQKSRKRYKENHPDLVKKSQGSYKKKKSSEWTSEDRFRHFKKAMQYCCCFVCVSCHRVLSKTEGHPLMTLKDLQEEMGKSEQNLFVLSIDPDIPEAAKVFDPEDTDNQIKVCFCSSCKRYLFDKKQLPAMSTQNGLKAEKIPKILQELNALEKTLISKRILFLKIVHLPRSRWLKNEGKTTNVLILDNDLLEMLNNLESFPRKPDEAGLLPVQLKRKLGYKNVHVEAYVRPGHLRLALLELKKQGHPAYQDINIETGHYEELPEDMSISDSDDSDRESCESDVEENNITKYQFKVGKSTVMSDSFPETTMVINTSDKTVEKKMTDESDVSCPIAPGEGKIPTNLMRDPNFDTEGFPDLHPSGQYGLNHERKQKALTDHQYFLQRVLNVDKRWSSNPAYLFVAMYYVERLKLEKQINLAYRRGTLENNILMDIEDLFSILDNVPGSHRFWQKRRYEIIAKLEQLGAFQFFFTLSCADKRWDENFVAILRQKGLKVWYEKGTEVAADSDMSKLSYQPEKIWVQERGKEAMLLDEYIKDENLHELVRENVLTITRVFDARVHALLSKIVMCSSNPMKCQYFHYRVEFQLRGAGHVHGVLWVDLKELEKQFEGISNVMIKLRKAEKLLEADKDVTVRFVDAFVSCSLEDEGISDIVEDVQTHKHTSTCFKKGKTCRFNFPRFPSDRTIIAQPLSQGEEESDYVFKKRKKKIKDTLTKVKEVLTNLTDDEVKEKTLEYVLKKAQVLEQDYYKALEISSTGTCIILKRKVSEININNYNPEILKAWNGNMDFAVCLDFFSIITYITDYYTKSESGQMLDTLLRAAKSCSGKDKKQQLHYLAHTFLTHRETGESEGLYRLIPSLHLSESNLKCEYLATGFPQNRYKFMVKSSTQNEDNLNKNDDCEEGSVEYGISQPFVNTTVNIPGHEGKFKAAQTKHDLYAARPSALNDICLVQFVIAYDKMTEKQASKIKFNNGVSGESSNHKIISENSVDTPLPAFIKLANKMGYMRVRNNYKVLRHHKYREDKQPHEFIYSLLLMYVPWRNEKRDCEAYDYDKCLEKFYLERQRIEAVQENLFPHKNSVEEARAFVEEFAEQRPVHTGDVLDPELQKENEEDAAEGDKPIDDLVARDPSGVVDKEFTMPHEKTIYKRIDISQMDQMLQSARGLDKDQRYAFNILIKFVKEVRSSRKSGMKKPKPVLLKIHGGAGCGKSKLINDIAAWVEYWMSFGCDKDPGRPSVIKASFTGRASALIQGTTLTTGFKIEWGINHSSLPDKTREEMRSVLANLTVIIIDEMSMVKSDLLYQLDLRLKEIKQSQSMFGGVSVILLGDLMQLRPVMANWIFDGPKNKQFRLSHAIQPLWEQFKAIELKTNHRQGKDKEYGDLLNRIRVGTHTSEDLELLKTRLTDKFPDDCLYVYGKRDPCRTRNEERLNNLDGEIEVFKATHIQENRKSFCPIIKDGFVNETPFLDELRLKIGARVMITFNVDTSDGLTNGTCGYVVGFIKEKGRVVKILLQLDEPEAGREARKKHKALLDQQKLPHATPIAKCCFTYSLGKLRKGHAATAKVIQYPLMLAWAVTAHKFQGGTVKSPTSLVADMDSIFEGGGAKAYGMAYVMLSRVQNISQLYLSSFDPKKIMVYEGALEELHKINKNALNNQPPSNWMSTNTFLFRISSLNITSLPRHVEDLHCDDTLKQSDVICLQETFCLSQQAIPQLEGYTCYLSGYGRGRGTASFVKNIYKQRNYLLNVQDWSSNAFQGQKLTFRDFHLLNIYR